MPGVVKMPERWREPGSGSLSVITASGKVKREVWHIPASNLKGMRRHLAESGYTDTGVILPGVSSSSEVWRHENGRDEAILTIWKDTPPEDRYDLWRRDEALIERTPTHQHEVESLLGVDPF